MKILCNYCGGATEYVDSSIVYRRSYGMIYYCRPCHAWVGVHRGTNRPLGRLANAELRHWKKLAHAAFDPIWKNGIMQRSTAYGWLSTQLGTPRDQTHIGMFDVAQCKQVIHVCKERCFENE